MAYAINRAYQPAEQLGVDPDGDSFQAPNFYRKHGYVVTGEFSDYRRGHCSIFLEKILS